MRSLLLYINILRNLYIISIALCSTQRDLYLSLSILYLWPVFQVTISVIRLSRSTASFIKFTALFIALKTRLRYVSRSRIQAKVNSRNPLMYGSHFTTILPKTSVIIYMVHNINGFSYRLCLLTVIQYNKTRRVYTIIANNLTFKVSLAH